MSSSLQSRLALSALTVLLAAIFPAQASAQSFIYKKNALGLVVSSDVVTAPAPAPAPGSFTLDATGASLSFGSLAVGATSSPALVTLNNTGGTTLGVTSLTTSGAFTSSQNCGAMPTSLAIGASCSINVAFHPVSAGAATGALTVVTDLGTRTIALSGVGQQAVLSANATALSWGGVALGSSVAQSFAVSNTGNIAATMSYSALPATVVQSGTCAATLAAGGSCSVTLTYTPVDTSALVSNLSVSSDTSSVSVGLTGSGAVLPAFTLSSALLNYGVLAPGEASVKTVTVTNTGNVPLTTPSVSSTGAAFAQSNTCGTSVAVGATCLVTVTATGSGGAADSGTLSVSFANASAKTASLLDSGPFYTKMLLKMDGTVGSTALVDTMGTPEYSHTGSASLVAGGVSGQAASIAAGVYHYRNIAYEFGLNDFTVEWWQKSSSAMMEMSFGAPGNYNPLVVANGAVYLSYVNGAWNVLQLTAGTPPVAANWTHYALVRNGATFTTYKNGVAQGTANLGTNTLRPMNSVGHDLAIGSYFGSYTGLVDNYKITVGKALYTGAFTPSTVPTVE